MGGCSSKPRTSEREGNTPTNQELNLMLSGLKAIDPSNPSQYKGSQHTLQSLFIQHHRDGEDVLENAQTLQELLQDSKALPNFQNESAGNTETQLASKDLKQHECKPSSPISVLADLAEQDAEKCKQTEGLLLFQEVAHEGTPALSFLAGQDADHCVSLEAADCKPHDATVEPKSDQLPSHAPNFSENVSAYPIFHEIRASKATGMPAPDVQALDAEALEAGINRHEEEVEGVLKSGEMAAESKIVKGPKEEPGTEGAVETRMQAELELEEAGKVLGAYQLEVQNEEAITVMECEALLVVQQHEVDSADSCLESEKAALQGIEVKAIEGEKAGLQAESVMEDEKLGGQDREHIESKNAGVQIEEDNENVKGRREHTEEEVEEKIVLCASIRQEGEKEKLQDEGMACLQGAVTSTHIEHEKFPGRSNKEETTCAKKAGIVQDGEGEELHGGFQRNEETRMQATHEGEPLEPTQTKAKTACEEPELDQRKLTYMENNVKEAASELTETLDFEGEKLESIRSVNEACRNDNVIEKFESEEQGSESMEHIQKDEPHDQSVEAIAESTRQAKLDNVPDNVESLEKESSQLTVPKEMFPTERDEHEQQVPNSPAEVELNKEGQDQALELSSSEDKNPVDAPFKQSLPEGNTTDNVESEQGVELEHDESNGVDSKEKKEESIEGGHDGRMEEPNKELTHTGMVADGLPERVVKDAVPI